MKGPTVLMKDETLKPVRVTLRGSVAFCDNSFSQNDFVFCIPVAEHDDRQPSD